MKITVCIGSSCHLKGARPVVEHLQALLQTHGLQDSIELSGTFCMGKCRSGVNVEIDGESFSVSPESVNEFFETNVLPRTQQ